MRATRKTELEDFKRRINLTEYAAAQDYVLDRKASSRNSITMRGPGNDKIIVGRDRDRLTIGKLRKALQPWIGKAGGPPRRPPREVEPITKDLARVRALFASMQPVEGAHRYLEQERNIPTAVLVDPIFAGRIYTDPRYGNAVFPHYDREGLCGFDLRNTSFKSFARGARKGLWYSV